MATGKVKWFDGQKGFGFIGQDDGGEDVFIHVNNLSTSGITTLKERQTVSFDITQGKKGLQATNVKVIRHDINNV